MAEELAIEIVQRPWGWNPATLTFGFGVLVVIYQLGRLFAAWLAGWNAYGPKNVIVFAQQEVVSGGRHVRAMRCEQHIDALRVPRNRGGVALTYSPSSGTRAGPVRSGTRHWTYDLDEGPTLGRLRWLLRCLRLSCSRRFQEPVIEPCQWCEI